MPTAPNKTASGTAHIAWQDIASAAQVIGGAITVSGIFGLLLDIRLGRRTGTAFTAGWPNIRVEGSVKSSGTDSWTPITTLQMAAGASIANTTLNGAITAGATSLVATAATNIAAGDMLFLGHTTDVTKYELVRVKSVSGTTITFEEACTNAHDNGCLITDQAEMYSVQLDVSAYQRVRVVIDNAGSGQMIAAQVLYSTFDSVG